MTISDKVAHYFHFSWGAMQMMREPIPVDWESRVRAQLENREAIWLDLVKRGILERPPNPYQRMLTLAGATAGDLEGSLRRDGLDATLERLSREGVLVTHDEFKGKTPIVRSGAEIECGPGGFLNPLARSGMESGSSGSRSRGTRTRKSAAYRMYSTAYRELQESEFGLAGRAQMMLRPVLPAGVGINNAIRYARYGRPIEKWYASGSNLADSAHYRALTSFLIVLARAQGIRAPFPTHLAENDFSIPAQWLAEKRKLGVECMVRSFVSPAVRVAATALDKGLDISGAIFLVGGEALSAAKRKVIESAGCEVYAGYTIHEVGPVGLGCRQMKDGNCVHLFSDSLAVVAREREAPLSGATVSSLMFTTLLQSAPYLFINAEMDDAGIVEDADCDCAFSRMGFRRRIREIASYGKMTGQGVTLVGTQVVEILERVLPARFGGAPTDYQLVEEEGAGQTQIVLRVSPRIGATVASVRAVFLEELSARYGGALAKRVWQHSDGFRVVSEEPLATATGKILSLHLIGGAQGALKHVESES